MCFLVQSTAWKGGNAIAIANVAVLKSNQRLVGGARAEASRRPTGAASPAGPRGPRDSVGRGVGGRRGAPARPNVRKKDQKKIIKKSDNF